MALRGNIKPALEPVLVPGAPKINRTAGQEVRTQSYRHNDLMPYINCPEEKGEDAREPHDERKYRMPSKRGA